MDLLTLPTRNFLKQLHINTLHKEPVGRVHSILHSADSLYRIRDYLLLITDNDLAVTDID